MLARSVCPFDCPDACGLLVEVEEGRAVRVRGDPDHPYSRGSLCPKMTGYDRTVHAPDRLLHPLVRTGPKGSGAFRRASWDEALDLVATRWRALLAEHGGEAILPYSYAGSMGLVQRNAGMALFHRLGASRLERTICTAAQGAGWAAVMGRTPGPHPDGVLDSDLVVLWGINAVATSLHFAQRVQAARRRGARVLLVDTYRTDTAPIADETLLVRPGSDGRLALGLVHVLAREGLADEAFLAAETVGWPELRARALAADCAPAAVAASTGVPAARIEALARELAGARAPFVRVGGGLSRHANGAMTVRSIVALSAVLGAPGRRGGGCLVSSGSAAAIDLAPLVREDLLERPTRIVNMNQLGRALTELDPPVRSMFVWCSNPAAVAPDQGAVLAGLAREDLFLVVHERFLTDTARHADVVLPATTSLEHADLYRSYGHHCLQRARAVLAPPGEARSSWQTFRGLAGVMGLDDPLWRLDEDGVVDLLLARPSPWREGLDLGRLAEGRAVELAVPRAPRWATASGRIELASAALPEPVPRPLPNASDLEPAPPLRLVVAPALHTLNSSFQERPDLRARAGGMVLKLAPSEAAARGLADGARVVAWNAVGEATFLLSVTDRVPPGVAVAEGVFWLAHAPGARNVNALVSQRLTDAGAGSTFSDNRVDVRAALG